MLDDKALKLETLQKIMDLMDSLKAQSMKKPDMPMGGDKAATMVAIEAKPTPGEGDDLPDDSMHEKSESPDMEAKEESTGEEDEDELLKKLAAQYAGIK